MTLPLVLMAAVLLYFGYLLWIKKRVDLLAGFVSADKNRLGTLTGLPLFISGSVFLLFAGLLQLHLIPERFHGRILAGISVFLLLSIFIASFTSGKYLYPPHD